jgi:hypothetical protein
VTGRACSKVACGDDAVATLTYDYADAMAVLGPLSYRTEPHSYDLCARHAERLSAPRAGRSSGTSSSVRRPSSLEA